MEDQEEGSIFSKEGTVSLPSSGIMRILVLQRMDRMLSRWESWGNTPDHSAEKTRSGVRCENSIKGLLAVLTPRLLEREKKRKDDFPYKVSAIKQKVDEKAYDDAVALILGYLENDLKLTKIDVRREYDTTNAETENLIKGL